MNFSVTIEIMCAKKTPTTPTKQNNLAGVTKAVPVKKVTAPKPQTVKGKADGSSNSTVKDVKINADAKKSTPATSSKKVTKAIVSETKAPSAPTTPVKGSIKLSSKDTKKINSRDSSSDNAKGKKQPVNGKTNKAKAATDSDRDKSSENKSNLIRDNKLTDTNDELKSKCDSANEQCNKFEKSSSSVSLKSNGESDNVVKDKEKLSKKVVVVVGEKARVNVPSVTSAKKSNNRSSDDGSKKSADKPKSSKIVKKVGKEKESKIKISNELKNLGIEMSKSNSSLAVFIQEGLTSSGVKTSICESVKTKARFCSNLNSGVKKNNAEIKIQSNKESQEKVIKDDEGETTKVNSDSVDTKKANSEHLKLIENDDKKLVHEVRTTAVTGKSKISALVNAKNKIKSFGEQMKHELALSNESDPAKPAKRKYVKKKRPDEATDTSKNSSSVSETDARNADKIDQNKSNCLSDARNGEVKETLKADEKRNETSVVGRKDKIESSSESTSNKTKVVSKTKSQEGSKVKKTTLQSLSCGEKVVGSKVELPSMAEKIKRKYVKKIKQVEQGDDKRDKLQKKVDITSKVLEIASEKPSEGESCDAQKVVDNSIETANDLNKTLNEALNLKAATVDAKKLPLDSQKTPNDLKKSVIESQRNGAIEKKLKVVSTSAEAKRPQDKPSKPLTPKKDAAKVEAQGKVARNKTKAKYSEKPPVKVTAKKQKVEVKQERDPLALKSSDSDNSSSDSDSDSDLSQGTFKKPSKSMAQRNLRHKKHIGHKQSRVASLNAIAKVHCFYENEARTLEANIAKAIKNSLADGSSDGEEDENDDAENESKNIDLASKR